MKKILLLLFVMLTSLAYSQEVNNCIACAESGGFYCGDDESNWTQYAPNGCVQASWINDGWEDCVDASDEQEAVPTTLLDCAIDVIECDTVYVDVPVVEYEYITEYDTIIEYVDVVEYVETVDTLEIPFYIYETVIQIDTLYQTEYITQIVVDTVLEIETEYITEYITQIVVDTIIEEVEVLVPEYIYEVDTVYAEVLDTMFIDVIEEVEVVVYDTITETEIEYVEFFVVDTVVMYDTIVNTEYIEFFTTDTIIEYFEVVVIEYVDCESGMPCYSSMEEIINNSQKNINMYNLQGQHIRKPEGIYIQNGQVKWHK